MTHSELSRDYHPTEVAVFSASTLGFLWLTYPYQDIDEGKIGQSEPETESQQESGNLSAINRSPKN